MHNPVFSGYQKIILYSEKNRLAIKERKVKQLEKFCWKKETSAPKCAFFRKRALFCG
jgi:hypothetical protein